LTPVKAPHRVVVTVDVRLAVMGQLVVGEGGQ
jgi:hypothetical protein